MKQLFKCAALFFGIPLALFLLLEGFLQIKEYWLDFLYERLKRASPHDVSSFFDYDPLLGWRNRPLQKGYFQTSESISYVSINAKGLRGKEYPYERTEKKRILVLGDSFVWGYGVEEKDRFTEKLEALFTGRVEVINAGVPGYGPDQSLLFLRREGRKYKPDLILCVVNLPDLFDILYCVNHGYPKPYFTIQKGLLYLQNVPVPQRSRMLHPFVQTTPYPETNPLLHFLETHTLTFPASKRWFRGSEQVAAQDRELGNRIFLAFQETGREMDAKLLFMLVPLYEDIKLGSKPPLYQHLLVDFLVDSGYPTLDLYDRLVNVKSREDLYFKRESKHWTVRGHWVVAEALYDFLRANNLP